jgi:hypothetical protein
MSNSLAIATVTTALYEFLDAAVGDSGVSVTSVTTQRPGEAGWDGGAVNLFLYGVETNDAWRNADVPTRGDGGDVITRPQAALNLNYLMTFFGDETQREPERVMATVASRLHARPILTRETVADTVASNPFLAGSDLEHQVELVRFTPLPLGIEELSKLWSVFPQANYGLSLAFQGSVLLIEEEEDVRPSMPVQARDFRGSPFRQPLIETVESADGPQTPIVSGGTVVVRGRDLVGDVTRLRIAGRDFVPASESATQLTLPVPDDLAAGVLAAQVVQLMALGDPPVPHSAVESNVAAFVLRPTVEPFSSVKVNATTEVTVDVLPTARAGQRASLLLNDQPGKGADAHRFTLDPLTSDTTQLLFVVSRVDPGLYVLRVQIDGAESPIAFAAGRWTPEVSIL